MAEALSISVTRVPVLIEKLDTPILLIGPPGIGKTAVTAEAAAILAKKSGKVLVDLVGEAERQARYHNVEYIRPRGHEDLVKLYDEVRSEPHRYFVFLRIVATQVTPEDLQYPRFYKGAILSMLPMMLAFLAVDGVEGILFIDEITNVAREDTATMLFALIQEKRVGLGGKLSDRVKIVAAGNPESVSSVARLLPAPLVNRFVVVNVSPPSVEEYIDYLLTRHSRIDDTVVAYLLLNGEKVLYQPPGEADTLHNYPTPRSWERVAVEAWKLADDDETYRTILAGLLGPRIGLEFYAFRKLKPPKPDELLRQPELLRGLSTEARMLAIVQLARFAAEQSSRDGSVAGRLADLVEKVMRSAPNLAEDLALLLRLITKLRPSLLRLIVAELTRRNAAGLLTEILRMHAVDAMGI